MACHAALGTESIPRLLIRFSLPAIVGTLMTALYSVVDRIFVGHGVGWEGIAAVSVTFPVMLIMMAFGMLIASGGNTLVAIRLGQNRPQQAEQVLGNAMTLYLLLSAAFTSFGLALLSPLLRLFGAGGNVLQLAEEYLGIILLGVLFHEISFGMGSFIRVDSQPRAAMLTMLIGGGLNLLLDPLFIFAFGWGLKGAAWATVLAQGVSAAWVMAYFRGGKSTLKLRAANLRLQPALVKRIALTGAPMWVAALAASAVQALLNNRLQLHGGNQAIAVMGIIFSISILASMPITGINQGVQPIIGYNYGARQFRRVGRALKLAAVGATTVGLLWFAVIELEPEQLIRLYNPHDRELVQMGTRAIRIFLLMLPLVGFQMVGAGYFQSVGKPGIAMVLALTRQGLFLVPLVLILPRYFGLNGIWMAAPAADLAAALTTACFLARELLGMKVNRQERPNRPACNLAPVTARRAGIPTQLPR